MPNQSLPNVGFVHNVFEPVNLSSNLSNLSRVISSRRSLASSIKLVMPEARNANFQLTRDEIDELVKTYNAVVKDGRYITQFAKEPEQVAANLNLVLSPNSAAAVVKAAGFNGVVGKLGSAENPAEGSVEVVCTAVIVVAVAVVAMAEDPREQVVVDRSGTIKI